MAGISSLTKTASIRCILLLLTITVFFGMVWSTDLKSSTTTANSTTPPPGAVCPLKCSCRSTTYRSTYNQMNCTGQGLKFFPEGIEHDINYLDLSFNRFQEFPAELRNLRKLQKLFFHGNNITSLNVQALSQLRNLNVLDLSHNGIISWKHLYFSLLMSTLPELTELSLAENKFADAFTDDNHRDRIKSSSLELLDLSHCEIMDVQNSYAFSQLNRLRILIMSDNYFRWFSGIASNSVEVLDLSRCRLKHIRSVAFTLLPKLRTLKLNDNLYLKLFPQFNPTSTSLNTIYLQNCNVAPSDLQGFPQLTRVFLAGNVIRDLPENSFKNNTLIKILDLSRASISKIHPRAFYNMTSMKELYLSENMISSLDAQTFDTNKQLSVLNLSRNRVRHLGKFYSSSLTVLDLSNCEVASMERSSLTGMPKLEKLNLTYNPLERIPEYLDSSSLLDLDLSYCRIVEINEFTFTDLVQLMNVKLVGNRLSEGLRPEMFPSSIKKIALDNNPWRCDCASSEFKSFYDYLHQTPAKIYQSSKLICQLPKNLTGYSWYFACKTTWFTGREPVSNLERIWMFLITTFLTIGVIFCIISTAKRVMIQRQEREREEMERLAEEARHQRMLRQRQRECAQLNAPDPRDLQSPPSYEEALLMLRPSNSDLRLKSTTSLTRRESRIAAASASDENIELQERNSDNEEATSVRSTLV